MTNVFVQNREYTSLFFSVWISYFLDYDFLHRGSINRRRGEKKQQHDRNVARERESLSLVARARTHILTSESSEDAIFL